MLVSLKCSFKTNYYKPSSYLKIPYMDYSTININRLQYIIITNNFKNKIYSPIFYFFLSHGYIVFLIINTGYRPVNSNKNAF